jgi:predicted metal-binding membrane protein
MTTSTVTRPVPRDPAPALWLVTGTCWAVLVLLLLTSGVNLASHDDVIEKSTLPVALRLLAFTGAWAVMIGAMMLPSTIPMARMFVAVTARQARPARARAAFATSYLVVWLGFALVALAGDTRVHWLVDRWPWLQQREPLILAATLVFAGAYQLSPLKDACLRACRTPFSMLGQHYRTGAAGGWRVGFAHALNCLGCCWALMLVMFATGVGSLLWMLGLAAVMATEKATRVGARLVVPVGVALMAAGAVLAVPILLGTP